MSNVMTVGLDIAKSVFPVHGVDAVGEVSVRRKLTRRRVLAFFESLPRCLVGIEACSSSHYWARELIARGHDVRLLPAQYVKPYLKRQKNDAADAEAICEAVTRPTMRFVPSARRYLVDGYAALLIQAGTAVSSRLRQAANSFNIIRIEHPRITVECRAWQPSQSGFEISASYSFRHGPTGWEPGDSG